jgi:hypothetical protein
MKFARIRDLFSADWRSLALFRIVLGLYILMDLARRAVDLTAHYTDAGVLPRANLRPMGRWMIPLHTSSGGLTLQVCLFAAAAVVAIAFTVGYRTRLAALLSWTMLLSLQHRNHLILSGGDGLLRIMLFWSIFLPLGQWWSLDRLRGRVSFPAARRGSLVFSAGVAGFLVQIASVYFFTGLLKAESAVWREGVAVYQTLLADHTSTALGTHLLQYPQLLRFLTYSTLVWESVGPLLFFLPPVTGPVRTLVAFSFVGLQVGIAACMEIGNFQSASIVMLLPMLSSWFWDRLLPGVGIRIPSPAADELPATASRGITAVAFEITAAFLGAYVLVCNLGTLFVHELPGRPERLAYAVGIDQRWSMYTGPFHRTTGWTVLHARLRDGRDVDLLTGKEGDLWQRPAVPSAIYPNWRWFHYYTRCIWDRGEPYHADLAAYLCRQWNSSHRAGERIDSLEIVWMVEYCTEDGGRSDPEKKVLYSTRCEPSEVP